MNKKLIVVIGITLLALALVSLALVGSTYAQDPTPPGPGYGSGYGPGMMGGNGMTRGGYSQYGRTMYRGVGTGDGLMHDAMQDEIAKALNLTREELDARIAAGETPAQIALAQGLSSEDFATIMTDARKAAMGQAVADGTLTQAQADRMLGRMAGRGLAGNCPMYPAQTNP